MYEYTYNNGNYYVPTKWRKKKVTEVERFYDENGNMISEKETITETEEPYYDTTWTSTSTKPYMTWGGSVSSDPGPNSINK